MSKSIDDMLNEARKSKPRQGRPCLTCKSKKIKAILVRYFERVDAEEEMPSLSWIHQKLIAPAVCFGAIRNHVIRCMHRDPATGESL